MKVNYLEGVEKIDVNHCEFKTLCRKKINGSMALKIIEASNGVSKPVYISFKDKEIRAKSILGILALEVGKGDSIVIKTSCQNIKDIQIQMKKILTDE